MIHSFVVKSKYPFKKKYFIYILYPCFSYFKPLSITDSNISVKSFGFSFKEDSNICSATKMFHELPEEDFKFRLEQVKRARIYYTYEGVLEQIDKFFSDPLGPRGGELTCGRVPETDHRKLKRKIL